MKEGSDLMKRGQILGDNDLVIWDQSNDPDSATEISNTIFVKESRPSLLLLFLRKLWIAHDLVLLLLVLIETSTEDTRTSRTSNIEEHWVNYTIYQYIFMYILFIQSIF